MHIWAEWWWYGGRGDREHMAPSVTLLERWSSLHSQILNLWREASLTKNSKCDKHPILLLELCEHDLDSRCSNISEKSTLVLLHCHYYLSHIYWHLLQHKQQLPNVILIEPSIGDSITRLYRVVLHKGSVFNIWGNMVTNFNTHIHMQNIKEFNIVCAQSFSHLREHKY